MRIPLRLVERRTIAPAVLHLCFEHADGEPLPSRAGQFLQLHLIDAHGTEQRRSYSMVQPPTAQARRWEILVGLAPGGLASARLAQVAIGETVEATGPFGRFGLTPRDQAPRYLMVATGTGIAPFRAMLPDLVARARSGAQVVVLHGVRQAAQLYFRTEFEAAMAETENLHYLGCVSGEPVDPAQSVLVAGRVQPVIQRLAPQPGDIACLCGHPDMVDEVAAQLREAGLSPVAIRRERFTAAG